MIQPGLSRISRLLAHTDLPWRAIHVAGTNGKGSICNYIASMLSIYNNTELPRLTGHHKLSWAKFTSPHLIDRWDGISINQQTITKQEFQQIEKMVSKRNSKWAIDASEFEVLTATAFEAFTKAKVDVGIVEVGMGGRLDATNILGQSTENTVTQPLRARPLVTAISKIGLDHQAFLGNTLAEIAIQKAGIMKASVPVVYDQSNASDVKVVLDRHAASCGIKPSTLKDLPELASLTDWSFLPTAEQAAQVTDVKRLTNLHVQQNTSVALRSTWLALSQLGRLHCPPTIPNAEFNRLVRQMLGQMSAVARYTPNAGRLERITFDNLSSPSGDVSLKLMLDGAHNAESAAALADEIAVLRQEQDSDGICWVIAVSGGRNPEHLLKPLLKPGDSVHAVEFGPVAGMPWVSPVAAQEVASAARRFVGDAGSVTVHGKDLRTALTSALTSALSSSKATRRGRWTVVAGSLYLIGDIHRMLRDSKHDIQNEVAAICLEAD